jgi:hypothetical protein
VREPVGRGERRKKRGLQLHWIPPCQRGAGSVGRRGGGSRWKACEGPAQSSAQIPAAYAQIDHRVSVVLPEDGERLTFCGVDGVRCWRSGHRIAVRVGCDAAHDTDTQPVKVLGDLGTDVRRVGRLACGLWVDALKPDLVGAGGAASVVGGDAAGGPLGAPKLPLESADGDEAESERARLRCVSGRLCLRGCFHLRAQPTQEHLQGLRGRLHLRPPPIKEQVQRLQATQGELAASGSQL